MEFHSFWFGVRLEFECSLCRITSEVGIMNSPIDDTKKGESWDQSRVPFMPHCKAPLGHGTEVDVATVPGTSEYLKTIGFQIPTVPL